jgi:predicted ATP-grasp superfamily ATP-dependent carboligase
MRTRTASCSPGSSASCLELAHNEELLEVGREIVARVPLKGVFKIDLKRDARTGRYRLLEINARFNLWHYLAARNGLNLPQVAYEYLLHGKRPRTIGYGTTYRWLSLRHDYRAFRELTALGELSALQWLGSLAFWPKVYTLFSWTDPMPYARFWMRRVKRLPRLTARLGRWLFSAS